jgi:multicomponent Na+:H+ antiporter subunit G
MTVIDLVTLALLLAGSYFFLAGTVGIVRFPDALSRLHALTKADNLGLGLIIVGLAVRAPSLFVAAKLILIWGLALVASATSCYLIANTASRRSRPRMERR